MKPAPGLALFYSGQVYPKRCGTAAAAADAHARILSLYYACRVLYMCNILLVPLRMAWLQCFRSWSPIRTRAAHVQAATRSTERIDPPKRDNINISSIIFIGNQR